MSFLVQLTDDAERDLEELSNYIDYLNRHDSPGRVDCNKPSSISAEC